MLILRTQQSLSTSGVARVESHGDCRHRIVGTRSLTCGGALTCLGCSLPIVLFGTKNTRTKMPLHYRLVYVLEHSLSVPELLRRQIQMLVVGLVVGGGEPPG